MSEWSLGRCPSFGVIMHEMSWLIGWAKVRQLKAWAYSNVDGWSSWLLWSASLVIFSLPEGARKADLAFLGTPLFRRKGFEFDLYIQSLYCCHSYRKMDWWNWSLLNDIFLPKSLQRQDTKSFSYHFPQTLLVTSCTSFSKPLGSAPCSLSWSSPS